MAAWEPPEDVDSVVVYGDNDTNYTGQLAAYKLANTLIRQGITVNINIPTEPGLDFNDVLIEKKGDEND
jgi:putative DNA primase/helicase